MHKIHEKEFTLEDFSCEQLFGIDTMNYALDSLDYECSATHPCGLVKFPSGDPCPETPFMPLDILKLTIQSLNRVRKVYLETKDKKYWWQMIQLLPSSYNQKRTVMLNYEVLANMYHPRKNHKLDEWSLHEVTISAIDITTTKDINNGTYPKYSAPWKETIGFCDWIETLPYSELITGEKKERTN